MSMVRRGKLRDKQHTSVWLTKADIEIITGSLRVVGKLFPEDFERQQVMDELIERLERKLK